MVMSVELGQDHEEALIIFMSPPKLTQIKITARIK